MGNFAGGVQPAVPVLSLGWGLEKGRGGVAMCLFRRDRLPHPENLAFEVGNIGLKLRHAEQVKRRGNQNFFCRRGPIFVRICHIITLTKG
jgi:hypothetical protein